MNFDAITWLKKGSIDLLVESYSNAAQTVQIRGGTRNEQIIADHTTNSDRSLASSTIDITTAPIFLTARCAATGVKRGQCYVRISLRVEGVIIAVLFADYLSDTNSVAYPNGAIRSSIEGPGLIRSITGTNPAAGTEISETVPTGAIWKLHSLFCPFTTDATVTTRAPYLILDDGTNVFTRIQTVSGITASLASGISFNSSSGVSGSGTLVSACTVPSNLLLYAGSRIRTTTVNLQAGDDYGTPTYCVEEWINP